MIQLDHKDNDDVDDEKYYSKICRKTIYKTLRHQRQQ